MSSDTNLNYPDVSSSVMLQFLKENGFTDYYKDDMFLVHCKKEQIPPIKFPKSDTVLDVTVAGIIYIIKADPKKSIERLKQLQSEENHKNRRI